MVDAAAYLHQSADRSGSLLCVGLDPRIDLGPGSAWTHWTNGDKEAAVRETGRYYQALLTTIGNTGKLPAAFKTNIAYFHRLDRPMEGYFGGSRLLAELLHHIRSEYPGVPVILDAKRGDIAESSAAYAEETMGCWEAQAVTVSPLMGDDSVGPFVDGARGTGKWIYLLTRTSNAGAHRFQALRYREKSLFEEIADAVIEWNAGTGNVGAVIGATAPAELLKLLRRFNGHNIPVLVPGVGAQGASAEAVIAALRETGYPPWLVRVNVSRNISAPRTANGGSESSGTASLPDMSPVRQAFLNIHEALRWT